MVARGGDEEVILGEGLGGVGILLSGWAGRLMPDKWQKVSPAEQRGGSNSRCRCVREEFNLLRLHLAEAA